ncbi:hypothetical protein AB0C27_51905 [Nonomuraea sp. NPDC048882]|uniref:hypothetical protein n=1 Tax=Nonomuraea sp. NPDC048882 TaxID=3154347 RepID=UPI0033DF3029
MMSIILAGAGDGAGGRAVAGAAPVPGAAGVRGEHLGDRPGDRTELAHGRKYLEHEGPVAPPVAARRPSRRNQVIDAYAPVVDAWLRAELLLKGTVIHEQLVEEYGFTGNYQRVKLYLQQARPRIAAELGYSPKELARLHRRFEVVPGAQAQVDWGDEGAILAHVGIAKVYSFHMVLSYSRDPFCCFTTSQDLAT